MFSVTLALKSNHNICCRPPSRCRASSPHTATADLLLRTAGSYSGAKIILTHTSYINEDKFLFFSLVTERVRVSAFTFFYIVDGILLHIFEILHVILVVIMTLNRQHDLRSLHFSVSNTTQTYQSISIN